MFRDANALNITAIIGFIYTRPKKPLTLLKISLMVIVVVTFEFLRIWTYHGVIFSKINVDLYLQLSLDCLVWIFCWQNCITRMSISQWLISQGIIRMIYSTNQMASDRSLLDITSMTVSGRCLIDVISCVFIIWDSRQYSGIWKWSHHDGRNTGLLRLNGFTVYGRVACTRPDKNVTNQPCAYYGLHIYPFM